MTGNADVKDHTQGHGHLITVLDRSDDPPALDAASSDYNKIVRQEYADPLYFALAHEAIARWRTPAYQFNYKEVGVVALAAKDHPQTAYVNASFQLNSQAVMRTPGSRNVVNLPTAADLRNALRCDDVGELEGLTACLYLFTLLQ